MVIIAFNTCLAHPFLFWGLRKDVVWPVFITMWVPSVVGVILGTNVLRSGDPRSIKTVLGATVFCLAVLQWWKTILGARRPARESVVLGEVLSIAQSPDADIDGDVRALGATEVAPSGGAGAEATAEGNHNNEPQAGAAASFPLETADHTSAGEMSDDGDVLQAMAIVRSEKKALNARLKAPSMLCLAFVAGFSSGLLTGLIGVAGPPLMIYVMCAKLDKSVTRATAVALIMFTMPFQAVALLTEEGLVRPELALPVYTPTVLAAAAGMWMGNRVHAWPSVTDKHVRVVVLSLLSTSASLLWGAGDTVASFAAAAVLLAWVCVVWLWMRYAHERIVNWCCPRRPCGGGAGRRTATVDSTA